MKNRAQVFDFDIVSEMDKLLAELEGNLVECRQLIQETQRVNAEISGLQLRVKRENKNRKQLGNAIKEVATEKKVRVA